MRQVQALGSQALISPQTLHHSELREQIARGGASVRASRADRIRRQFATRIGGRLYLQRQASVEPVFGTTRAGRGLRVFLHHGFENNHHLWRFDMAVHNLKEINVRFRAAIAPPPPPSTPRRATNGNPTPTQSPA